MTLSNQKTPKWFTVMAIFFLLWNIMGVISFFSHTFISDEILQALPENERALYTNFPLWVSIIFAIAVITGLSGSVGLLLKKKWAKLASLLSMLAIIPQMTYNTFYTDSIAVYGLTQAIFMPILVVIIGALLIWLSSYSIKKKWLS